MSKSLKSTRTSARGLIGQRTVINKSIKEVNKNTYVEDEDSLDKPINVHEIFIGFRDKYGVLTKRA